MLTFIYSDTHTYDVHDTLGVPPSKACNNGVNVIIDWTGGARVRVSGACDCVSGAQRSGESG